MSKILTLGCDPELFLKNKDGKFIASCDKIGGTKDVPLQIKGLPHGFAVQEDNVSVEFCVPPAATRADFIDNVQQVLRHIQRDFVFPLGLELAFGVASKNFDQDQLESEKAQTFGCDPDYNVYTLAENPKPVAVEAGLRTAGGHIHFGFDNPTESMRHAIVRAADLFLGIPSLFVDQDANRRLMYGKAGAHRAKPYGVEYRTLSNFWIGNEKLIGWAFDQAERAFNMAQSDCKELFKPATGAMTQLAINTNNITVAKMLVKKFNLEIPA